MTVHPDVQNLFHLRSHKLTVPRPNPMRFVGIIVTVSFLQFGCGATQTQQPAETPKVTPSTDAQHDFERRAKSLVAQMTLEEKIGQLMDDAPAIPRLNVPKYVWWNEALHGVARAGQATVFPQAIGMAATFDENLIYHVADVISSKGRHFNLEELKADAI